MGRHENRPFALRGGRANARGSRRGATARGGWDGTPRRAARGPGIRRAAARPAPPRPTATAVGTRPFPRRPRAGHTDSDEEYFEYGGWGGR